MAVKALRSWVRAVDARDAQPLLHLHRELWFDHDMRGGMPASRDEMVWVGYSEMLERQVSHRMGRRVPGSAFEGKLGHFVAEYDGQVVGQVEVFLERFGWDTRTPFVAELRSLIVTRSARGLGLGAALVREAAASARARAGTTTLVSAEVLARNEALAFYDRLGFRTLERIISFSKPLALPEGYRVRPAVEADAREVTILDLRARRRRRGWGDPRFDEPPLFPSRELVRATADGLAAEAANQEYDPARIRQELVALDRRGKIVGSAYFTAGPLGVPFAPVTRAEITRLAADPDNPDAVVGAQALVAYALQRSFAAHAQELLVRAPFLDPTGATLATLPGARPFSWILATPAATLSRRR